MMATNDGSVDTASTNRDHIVHATFTALLVLAFAAFAVASVELGGIASYLPLMVGVPGIVVGAILLVRDLRTLQLGDDGSDGTADTAGVSNEQQDEGGASPETLSATSTIVWISLLSALFWLLGTMVAIGAFTFSYMLFAGRERVKIALICSGILVASVYLFFVQVLKAPIYPGLFSIPGL